MEYPIGAVLPIVAFEIMAFFTGVRAAYVAFEWRGVHLSNLGRVAAWVAASIVVASSISGILAFGGFHEPAHYWIAGSAFLIASHAGTPAGLRAYARWLEGAAGAIADNLPRWQALVVFSVAAPFLLMVIRPIDETDSLFNLQFMLDWLFSGRNPYWMNSHNPSFWELSYLPSIVLGGGDHFFWAVSIKTILLIGTVNYMLGRKIGIPPNLCWMACLAGALFFLLWQNPSGLGTIKTDMLFAAGVSLLAYGILGAAQGSRRAGIIWFTLGAIFVLSKLSGVGVLLASVLILAVFARKTPARPKLVVLYACAALLAVAGTSGHYYTNSMAEYGNPFYPHKVTIFGVGFHSGMDRFVDTSIMSSVGDGRLWGYLLDSENVFAAGILYPAVAACGILGTSAVVAYNAYSYIRKKRLDRAAVALSLFLLLTWLIFLFHYGGASHVPGDLLYIKELSSFRYVEGTFIITELFLVYLLLRPGIPRALPYAVAAIGLGSRVAYLADSYPPHLDYFLAAFPIAAAAGLALLTYKSRNRILKVAALSAFFLAASWTAPNLVNENRQGWLPWYNDTVMEIHHDEPATVSTVSGSRVDGGQKLWPLTYPWRGSAFQHDVAVVTLDGALARLGSGDPLPDHLVALCNPNYDCGQEFREMESTFAEFGYGTSKLDRTSMLLTAPPRSG